MMTFRFLSRVRLRSEWGLFTSFLCFSVVVMILVMASGGASVAWAAQPGDATKETKEAVDHFVPAEKNLSEEWYKKLYDPGEPAWYQGEDLKYIAMPIGGIAAGQVYLLGDGRLSHWDIFNRHTNSGYGAKNYRNIPAPDAVLLQGFAIKAVIGAEHRCRKLDKDDFPGVRFCGEYPLAFVEYVDAAWPLKVTLEAFSPFVPLNSPDSALPATVLKFRVQNTSRQMATVSLCGWLQNGVLYHSASQGGFERVNRGVRREKPFFQGVLSTAEEIADRKDDSRPPLKGAADFGSMMLAVLSNGERQTSVLPAVATPPQFETAEKSETTARSAPDAPLVGEVVQQAAIPAGEEAEFTFVVAWYFPNRPRHGNYYANRFASAEEVVKYISENRARLFSETVLWHDTWYDSTLPRWLLDRLFMPTANLATSTCQWWKNGRFWAWEGVGCCHGTCGHVWNYAHALARLFPDLERSVREMQDFNPAAGFIEDTGEIRFRGEGWKLWAGDSQGGYILKAYREHQMSPDDAFLRRNWPRIRKAVEFLIRQDGNADGLIEGAQHNTYDIDFYGPNTMVGSLYLGALKAAEEMARELKEDDFAETCRKIFEAGRKNSVEKLFNGEYFIQLVDLKKHPKHQYADGCLSDQLFGEGWAAQVGLGYLYPPETVRATLKAIWRYNWAPDVGPQNAAHPPERWFARPGEPGLFTCTWPKSKHLGPESVRYRDEIWTGIEYQVAGHMAYEGMLDEALSIVRGIHERYHPRKMNPWNEVECGDHYARALASYGVFIALCGYEYHGPAGRIGFAPRLQPENFRAAFTAAEGWGTFAQKRSEHEQLEQIVLRWGKLRVQQLSFQLPEGAAAKKVTLTNAGQPLSVNVRQEGNRLTLTLSQPVIIAAGQTLEVKIAY